jgi:hypothetical protein
MCGSSQIDFMYLPYLTRFFFLFLDTEHLRKQPVPAVSTRLQVAGRRGSRVLVVKIKFILSRLARVRVLITPVVSMEKDQHSRNRQHIKWILFWGILLMRKEI